MSDYTEIKKDKEPMVYVLQELPGTSTGRPKFNIMGALKYGKLKVLLKENAQIVLSPGPVIFELRRLLKNFCHWMRPASVEFQSIGKPRILLGPVFLELE